MNRRITSLLIASLALLAPTVRAERGHGLHREYKTIYVPLNQQSGWGLQTESQPVPVKAEPPQPKKVEKVEAPVPVQQAEPVKQAEPVAQAVPEKDWRLTGVTFETGSDKLKSESQGALNEAVQILKNHPRVVVQIQGHTDNVGNSAINQTLSDKRAMAVKKYLTDNGVGADRLESKGYGASQPIADNNTVEGRAQNRRIEFKVLKK